MCSRSSYWMDSQCPFEGKGDGLGTAEERDVAQERVTVQEGEPLQLRVSKEEKERLPEWWKPYTVPRGVNPYYKEVVRSCSHA